MANPKQSNGPVWDYAGWWLARNVEFYTTMRDKYYPEQLVYDATQMWPYRDAKDDSHKMCALAMKEASLGPSSFAYTSSLWCGLWCMFWGWVPWQMLIGKDTTSYETTESEPDSVAP